MLEARIAADPRYTALVRDRQRFSWTLTAITMIVYSAFISLIAFDKPLMAQPVGGGTVSLAVLPGVAMLIGTVAICAIYVRRANVSYDVRLAELLASARARRRAFGAALLSARPARLGYRCECRDWRRNFAAADQLDGDCDVRRLCRDHALDHRRGSPAHAYRVRFIYRRRHYWLSERLAMAGNYCSAASLLGITSQIFNDGYDGLIYAIGFLVGWPVVLFLVAEKLRNLGRFTFADVASYRFLRGPVRTFAAVSTLRVVSFYLIAQMVGAGS